MMAIDIGNDILNLMRLSDKLYSNFLRYFIKLHYNTTNTELMNQENVKDVQSINSTSSFIINWVTDTRVALQKPGMEEAWKINTWGGVFIWLYPSDLPRAQSKEDGPKVVRSVQVINTLTYLFMSDKY